MTDSSDQTSFAPEPWFAGKVDKDEFDVDFVTVGPFVADNHYESTVAEVWGGNYDAVGNAHLIAAAPELVAACERLLKQYERMQLTGNHGYWNMDADENVIAARAALSKARGKS